MGKPIGNSSVSNYIVREEISKGNSSVQLILSVCDDVTRYVGGLVLSRILLCLHAFTRENGGKWPGTRF